MRIFTFLFLLLSSTATLFSQNFSIRLEPMQINNMPGIQAFAFGQTDEGWILVGGRTDGLHRRQPFASFDVNGNNTNIYLVNPVAKTVLFASINSLPTALKEQLQSTNMSFQQDGDNLYIVGGYGYAASAADHITHPYLTVVDLPGLAAAIKANGNISPYFKQYKDARFAVTGGYINVLNGVFYMVGGNRFDGRYNPMGNNTYVQKYTEQIKKFTVTLVPNLQVTWVDSITDAANLHRRDYNLTPQIFPSGEKGFTAWSGVFQPTADLPFLNSVDITANGHTVNNNFNQYLSQYHCAHMPVFDASAKQMSTVFFGGIAQYYYDSNNTLVKDDDVPFVNTISVVTRKNDGSMVERKIGEMPGLLGSSAEFIPAGNAPFNKEEILLLDSINGDSLLAGYIVGGINSSGANIFFTNDGTQSSAQATVYKVFLTRQSNPVGMAVPKEDLFSAKVFSPQGQEVIVEINNPKSQKYSLSLTDITGKQLYYYVYTTVDGYNSLRLEAPNLKAGIYLVNIHCGQVYQSHKVMVW